MLDFVKGELARMSRELEELVRRGRHAEAVEVATQVCDAVRRHLGDDHPSLATGLVNLGDLHVALRDYAAAEAAYRQALDVRRAAFGESHRALVPILARLTQVYVAMDNAAAAEAAHREAAAIRRATPEEPADEALRPAGPARVRSAGGTTEGRAAPDSDLLDALPGIWAEPPPGARARPAGRGIVGRLLSWVRGHGPRPAPQRDLVQTSVFASPTVARGQMVFIQVFAHRAEQLARVVQRASVDEAAEHRGTKSLNAEVERGATLAFHLTFDELEVAEAVESVVWRGTPEPVQFGVSVPKDQERGVVLGSVMTSVDGVPVGKIGFKLTITDPESGTGWGEPEPLGEVAPRYKRAFLSCAAHDYAEVIRQMPVLKAAGLKCFLAYVNIESGEPWEEKLYEQIDGCDLFLLFWSSSAKSSEWVEREWRRALTRKGRNHLAAPEIVPVIIEGPPIPEPPEELTHLHFSDYLLYLAKSREAEAHAP